MKTIDVSKPAWMVLGELELTFSANAEGVISPLLEEVLEPLGLPPDLRTRMLNSAQEGVARIMRSNGVVLRVGHIHLLILIAPAHSSKGQAWGFFRIEKMDGAQNDDHPHDHAIEFYLYVDD